MRRLLLLAPLAALVLTGCIRAEIAIRVNEDGSGTVSLLTAVDGSVLAAFASGEGGSGLGDLVGDGDIASAFTDIDEADLPSGASVEAYEDGDFVGARVTVPFAAGDDVASALERLSADGGDDTPFAGVGGAFESFVLERGAADEGGWRFDARLSDDATDAGLGEGGGDAFGDAIASALLGDASFTVRLALPGEIVEHNADEISGGELVWHLDVLDPGARPLMARSEASAGSGGGVSTSVLVVGLLVVAGLLTAGAVGWAVRERSRG